MLDAVEQVAMTVRFDACVALVLNEEGSAYTNRPSDGPTKWGITLDTLTRYNYATMGQKSTSTADVSTLGRYQASLVYKALYWIPLRCDELPAGLDLMVFDCGVNQGQPTAVRLLQQALGVTVDGQFGQKTMDAVRCTDAAHVVTQMAALRLYRYRTTANAGEYLAGWTNRLNTVTATALAATRAPLEPTQ
ncbi:MAG: glycoside hydrolase family 108 protein [Caulobacteraceae bacterium]